MKSAAIITVFGSLLLAANMDEASAITHDPEKKMRRDKIKAERAAARADAAKPATMAPLIAASMNEASASIHPEKKMRRDNIKAERAAARAEIERKKEKMASDQRDDQSETAQPKQKTETTHRKKKHGPHDITPMREEPKKPKKDSAVNLTSIVNNVKGSQKKNIGLKNMANKPQPTKFPTMAPKTISTRNTDDFATYTPTYFPTTFIPTSSPTFIGKWGQAFQGPLPKYTNIYGYGKSGKGMYKVPYVPPPTDMPTTFMPTTFPPTEDPNATPSPNTMPTYVPTYIPTTYTPTFSPIWYGGGGGSGKSGKGQSNWWSGSGKSGKGESHWGSGSGGKSGKGEEDLWGGGHVWHGTDTKSGKHDKDWWGGGGSVGAPPGWGGSVADKSGKRKRQLNSVDINAPQR